MNQKRFRTLLGALRFVKGNMFTMSKSLQLRRVLRCSWRGGIYNDLNGRCCNQYVTVKTFSAQHRTLQKCIVNFSVQSLCNYEFYRYYVKKKRTTGVAADESDEEEDEDDTSEDDTDKNGLDQGYKTVMKTVPSLRVDTIVKTGLGTSKRTVEKDFYTGKFRINGEKAVKKSLTVHEGDEIDVVKEIFPENENFLVVNRVVVKSIGNLTSSAQFPVKLQVFKALIIENYEDKWP